MKARGKALGIIQKLIALTRLPPRKYVLLLASYISLEAQSSANAILPP
jgi:hypothetical protein